MFIRDLPTGPMQKTLVRVVEVPNRRFLGYSEVIRYYAEKSTFSLGICFRKETTVIDQKQTFVKLLSIQLI